MDFRQIMKENPLLTIMRNVPMDITLDYVGAVIEGGCTLFEVALNTPHALEQIALMREHFGDKALIGAGTAITIERAKTAVEAGAQFLLAPSTDEDVLAWCQENKVAILPGVLTPSDVSKCLRYGFDVLKLFPAGDMPKGYIKSLKGPLDGTDYVAIGGVNRENLNDFMKQGYIGVGLGSNIIPKEMIAGKDWQGASAYVAELIRILKGTEE